VQVHIPYCIVYCGVLVQNCLTYHGTCTQSTNAPRLLAHCTVLHACCAFTFDVATCTVITFDVATCTVCTVITFDVATCTQSVTSYSYHKRCKGACSLLCSSLPTSTPNRMCTHMCVTPGPISTCSRLLTFARTSHDQHTSSNVHT
jgi:hypothetical protein